MEEDLLEYEHAGDVLDYGDSDVEQEDEVQVEEPQTEGTGPLVADETTLPDIDARQGGSEAPPAAEKEQTRKLEDGEVPDTAMQRAVNNGDKSASKDRGTKRSHADIRGAGKESRPDARARQKFNNGPGGNCHPLSERDRNRPQQRKKVSLFSSAPRGHMLGPAIPVGIAHHTVHPQHGHLPRPPGFEDHHFVVGHGILPPRMLRGLRPILERGAFLPPGPPLLHFPEPLPFPRENLLRGMLRGDYGLRNRSDGLLASPPLLPRRATDMHTLLESGRSHSVDDRRPQVLNDRAPSGHSSRSLSADSRRPSQQDFRLPFSHDSRASPVHNRGFSTGDNMAKLLPGRGLPMGNDRAPPLSNSRGLSLLGAGQQEHPDVIKMARNRERLEEERRRKVKPEQKWVQESARSQGSGTVRRIGQVAKSSTVLIKGLAEDQSWENLKPKAAQLGFLPHILRIYESSNQEVTVSFDDVVAAVRFQREFHRSIVGRSMITVEYVL